MKPTRFAALLLPLALAACGDGSSGKPAASAPAPTPEPPSAPVKTAFLIFVPAGVDARVAAGLRAGAQQYLAEKRLGSREAVIAAPGAVVDWKHTDALIAYAEPSAFPTKPSDMKVYVPTVLIEPGGAAPAETFTVATEPNAPGGLLPLTDGLVASIKDGKTPTAHVADTVALGRKAAELAHQAIKGEGKLPEGLLPHATVPPLVLAKEKLTDPNVKIVIGEK